MIILPKHKAVFVSTPKCATVSMFSVLKERYGGHHAAGTDFSGGKFHMTAVPEEYQEWFTFTICRHPAGRAVSFWRHSIHHELEWFKRAGYHDLARFASALARDRRSKSFRQQSAHLEGVRLDMVLRFENIIEEVCRLPFWDSSVTFPHLNRTGDSSTWQQYMTPGIAGGIRKWAARDFDLYGYSKDF